jgi:uncharacterized membrane protein YoaK (UPF0700 family)
MLGLALVLIGAILALGYHTVPNTVPVAITIFLLMLGAVLMVSVEVVKRE